MTLTPEQQRAAMQRLGIPAERIDAAMGAQPTRTAAEEHAAQRAQRLIDLAKQRRETENRARNFKILCTANGLPLPVREHRFAAPKRQWQADFAFVDEKVIVEVEGGIATNGRHVRIGGYKGDMEKYSTANALGWKVIRVTPQDLCSDATIQIVRQALSPLTPEPK